MTKEVVHLLAVSLGSEPLRAATHHPLPAPEAAPADRSAKSGRVLDGREALRAALIKQPDGSFVNVLGIDDSTFFDTLQRVRAEAKAPDVKRLFDDKP